jgi:3-methyladenine DNA glycosylase AlkD
MIEQGQDQDIVTIFRNAHNPALARQMEAYMKNRFPFLGLPRPVRNTLQKEFILTQTKSSSIDWAWVFEVFNLPEREFQYLAMDYLARSSKKLHPRDLIPLKELILTKSWWDTVDTLSSMVGVIALKYPEVIEKVLVDWSQDSSIWVRRVSIICQLKFRESTNTIFLENSIKSNLGSKEFFINKAIGWALRANSKTNPEWVRNFIDKNELAPLSVREGSKYL